MLGPLWPLVILGFLAGTLAGLTSADPVLRLIGLAAGASGLAYLVFPTGASDLANGTTLFEVNLRYATPALALGLVVLPIVLRTRSPRWLTGVALLMVMILLSAQLERPLWPTQPARHAAFLLGAGVVALAVLISWRRPQGEALGGGRRFAGRWVGSRFALTGRRGGAVLGLAGLLVSAGVSYGAQRHYYAQRYLVGGATEPGLAAIDRWAQHVSEERIALYGSVQQYPLFGARDTNRVAYLGQPAAHGGYRPISSCQRWRQAINHGRYDYLVLTPAPTGAIPVNWTLGDSAAKTVLHPTANTYLFRLTGRLSPRQCR
jgi:hypothetical protein